MRLSFARTRFYHEWKVKQLAFREYARIENARRYNRQGGFVINPFRFGVTPPTDPYFANVVSLLPFDGTDGSTTYTDVIGKTWTNIGAGPELDTTIKKFGTASFSNIVGVVGISTPDHADWNTAGNDFVREAWIQFTSLGIFHVAFAQWDSAGGNKAPFLCYINSTEKIVFGASTTNASWDFLATSASTLSIDTWYHVAQVRLGTAIHGMVDGVDIVTPGTLTGSVVNNADLVTIGNVANNPGSLGFDGYIDDWRATNGTDRGYAGGFTPPTAAHPTS